LIAVISDVLLGGGHVAYVGVASGSYTRFNQTLLQLIRVPRQSLINMFLHHSPIPISRELQDKWCWWQQTPRGHSFFFTSRSSRNVVRGLQSTVRRAIG